MTTRRKPRHRKPRASAHVDVASPSPSHEARGLAFGARRALIAAAGVALVLTGAVASLLLVFVRDGDDTSPSAVIIDQLASTDANPAFVDEATSRLEAAGYRVDYLSGREIDVDLFRSLPKRGYDVILVRNHVGQLERRAEPVVIDTGRARALVPAVQTREVATFFTNELYRRDEHVDEQQARLLGVATYPPPNEDGKQYFGVTPEFIAEARGEFDGALVILMGCGGAGSEAMAQAFLGKGAGSVVTWDDLVTATHTDGATRDLLDRVLRDEPVAAAVAGTMASVGPDPSFGARLRAYE